MHVHVVAVALEELSYQGSLTVHWRYCRGSLAVRWRYCRGSLGGTIEVSFFSLEVLSRFAYCSLEVLSRFGTGTVRFVNFFVPYCILSQFAKILPQESLHCMVFVTPPSQPLTVIVHTFTKLARTLKSTLVGLDWLTFTGLSAFLNSCCHRSTMKTHLLIALSNNPAKAVGSC